MEKYLYTKLVDSDKLIQELVVANLPGFLYLNTLNENITLAFSESLHREDKLILDQVISSHRIVDPLPDNLYIISAASNGQISTSSSTFSTIDDVAITLTPGSYILIFTCNLKCAGVNSKAEVKLQRNNVDIAGTFRRNSIQIDILGLITLSTAEIEGTIYSSGIIQAEDGDIIKPVFRRVSGGSVESTYRSMKALRRLI
jgi:hypothetical protein